MPAVSTAGAGETVCEDAAIQVVAEGLFHVSRGCVQVALPIELTGTGQRQPPGLEMRGDGTVQQGLLRVTALIELLRSCALRSCSTRVLVRWHCALGSRASGGGHCSTLQIAVIG